jgi:serine/threonine protein kinase
MARTFGNRWQVREDLDSGGQAHVYIVQDLQEELKEGERNLYVLKRLKNHARLKRFENEIVAGKKLDHPGIAPILDYSLSEPAYYVTNYYRGGTLTERVERGVISPLDALAVFMELCEIAHYAHSCGVYHRDLKPDNIVFDEDGDPVMIDFGLCYFTDEGNRLTETMEQVGSRFYMAPEMEAGRSTVVTATIDSYSLGKVLYFMLTGRHVAREDFTNLVAIMGEPQLGYVSERILAQSVVEDPARRLAPGQLVPVIATVQRLIREHYYPGIEGSLCRFCGEGTYGRAKETIMRLDEPGVEHSVTFDAYICERCRNVEWFRREGR